MWRMPRSFKGCIRSTYLIQNAKYSSRSENRSKLILSGIVASAAGFSGVIVYGKFDPNFKQTLVNYVPFTKSIYDLFESNSDKESPTESKKPLRKDIESPIVQRRKNVSKEKVSKENLNEVKNEELHPTIESKADSKGPGAKDSGSSFVSYSDASKSDISGVKDQSVESSYKKNEVLSREKLVLQMLDELRKTSNETLESLNKATKSISLYTEKLYEAVDLSEGNDDDLVRKEAKEAALNKEQALYSAKQKSEESKKLIGKVRESLKRLTTEDPNNNLVEAGVRSVEEFEKKLKAAESEVSAANAGAKTAADYEQLVKASKEQFEKELKIVLPKLVHQDRKANMSEDDLNVLITHAHRRIEKLQKEIAKLKIAEKSKIEEAVRSQKKENDDEMEARIMEELKRRNVTLESAVDSRASQLKEKLESDFHKQLLRQAAAHADHLKEALNIQSQELERKHNLEVEEKLLHEKGKFITEVSSNMTRMKGIVEFLKAKKEFEKSAKEYQALSLVCQALSDKIHASAPDHVGKNSLSKDVAAIKVIAKDSSFISSIINLLPEDVLQNGVSSRDALKYRFQNVKRVCRKVSLVDENNDSLFRYLLSYIQSVLVFDDYSGIQDELKGLKAVDTQTFDTYDILSRITYCLDHNDFEQSLRYAHLLRGEAKSVAGDWIKEVTRLLEAELVVKALTAHVSALRVQAYH